MSTTMPSGWPRRRPIPSLFALFGKAISRSPSTRRRPASAIRASSRSTAIRWREAAESYFVQSEQIPSLVRVGVDARAAAGMSPAGCCSSICPRARRGASGCTPGSTIPNGSMSRCSAATMGADELADPRCRSRRWSGGCSTRRTRSACWRARVLARGCRCDADYIASVLAKFPDEERAEMADEDGMIQVDCAFCAHHSRSRRAFRRH